MLWRDFAFTASNLGLLSEPPCLSQLPRDEQSTGAGDIPPTFFHLSSSVFVGLIGFTGSYPGPTRSHDTLNVFFYLATSSVVARIIEKVGPWSIFSRPKNGSTSLQNSLFEHNAKSRSASKRRKTAQLRSKTASSIQHNSVLVVTSQSPRGYFAVTSRSQRGCYAVAVVTTRSLRGYYGHYAVTTVTTQSERAHIRD